VFILRGENSSAAYMFIDVTHRLIARVFLFSSLDNIRVNAEDNANYGQDPHHTVELAYAESHFSVLWINLKKIKCYQLMSNGVESKKNHK
jgi:hypothetical protein